MKAIMSAGALGLFVNASPNLKGQSGIMARVCFEKVKMAVIAS